jgi:hypothetical protein
VRLRLLRRLLQPGLPSQLRSQRLRRQRALIRWQVQPSSKLWQILAGRGFPPPQNYGFSPNFGRLKRSFDFACSIAPVDCALDSGRQRLRVSSI